MQSEEVVAALASSTFGGIGDPYPASMVAAGSSASRSSNAAAGPAASSASKSTGDSKPTTRRPFSRSASRGRSFFVWEGKRGSGRASAVEPTPQLIANQISKLRRMEDDAFAIIEMQVRFCLCAAALIGDFATLQLLLSCEQESPKVLGAAMQAGKLAVPPSNLPPQPRGASDSAIVKFLADFKGGSMAESTSGSTTARVESKKRELAMAKEHGGVDADLLVCGPLHAGAAGGNATVLDLLTSGSCNQLTALTVESPSPYYSPPKRKAKGAPLPAIASKHDVIGEALPSQIAWLCSNVVAHKRLAENEVQVRVGVVKKLDNAAQQDVKEAFERANRPKVRPRRRMSLLDQVHASSVIMEGKDGGSTLDVHSSVAGSDDMSGMQATSSVLGEPRQTKKPAVAPLTMTGALDKLKSTQDLAKTSASGKKMTGMKHLLDTQLGSGQFVTSHVFDKSMPRSLQLSGIAGKLKAKRKPSRL